MTISVVALGGEYVAAYIAHADNAAALIERPVHWMTTATLFMMMKLFGASTGVAFMVHGAAALGVVVLMALRARRYGVTAHTLAMFIGASLMMSPYVTDYDLTILAGAGVLLFAPSFNAGLYGRFDFFTAVGLALLPISIVGFGRAGYQIGWLGPAMCILLAEARLRALNPADFRFTFGKLFPARAF